MKRGGEEGCADGSKLVKETYGLHHRHSQSSHSHLPHSQRMYRGNPQEAVPPNRHNSFHNRYWDNRLILKEGIYEGGSE